MVAGRQGARARDHLASLAAPKRQPMCARAAQRAKGWAVAACAVQAVCKLSAESHQEASELAKLEKSGGPV